MFKLDSEEALLRAFRPKDRELVELSPDVRLGEPVRGYLAWTHPAGGRVNVVFTARGGPPTGIVFDTNGSTTAPVPQMCEWCHFPGVGSQVALLTARVNGKKRAGVHLCVDLSCKQKLEDEADRAGRSALPAIEGLVERIARFAEDALGIDLTGAGRD